MKRVKERIDGSAKQKKKTQPFNQIHLGLFTLDGILEKPWNFRDLLYIAVPQYNKTTTTCKGKKGNSISQDFHVKSMLWSVNIH